MPSGFQSTLLLTVLLAIGLVFFLRAASKDRTTVVDVHSPRPPIEVLNGISNWLEQRGWSRDGGDAERQVLRFRGEVAASRPLAILLSALAAIGGSCFGLVLRQLAPQLQWWPLRFSTWRVRYFQTQQPSTTQKAAAWRLWRVWGIGWKNRTRCLVCSQRY